MSQRLRSVLKKAQKTVEKGFDDAELPIRTTPLPAQGNVLEETEVEDLTQSPTRRAKDYVEMEITGSKGKKYRIAVPASYAKVVPKVWKWTPERYKVASDIASGLSMVEVAEINGYHRTTLYGWLEHPEFREHVDGLILEGGMANRRERIATLSRISDMLVRKIARELDGVKLTDKSIGAVLTTIGQYAKHLAQEKEEFVEQSKVEQDTTLNGKLDVAHINVNEVLNNASDEERKRLEEEFDQVADEIIRGITGDKE